jgi:phosphoglycerate dehydrogenase-like enzyme
MQMLVMCRHFPFYCINQKAGAWVRRFKETFFQMRELWGKTIGIIGTGDIGSCLATRAKAFGMTTIGCNRTGRKAEGFDTVVHPGMLDMLLKESDFVVLALPLTGDTRYLIGERELGMMKPSAIVINVSRGSVIDEKALIAALKDRRIAAAALDVFEEEPLPSGSPLWKMENVVITPHCAGWGENFKRRYLDILHANCRRFLAGDYSGMTGRVC